MKSDDVDNYCIDCCGICDICCKHFHPKYKEEGRVKLDGTIRQMFEDIREEDAESVLGDDVKDGDERIDYAMTV